jgi:hypothetical protein
MPFGKIKPLRTLLILGGGGLAIYLAIKFGESNIGWVLQ